MPTSEQDKRLAQLVRIHESNCRIDYPTRDEAAFRLAVMKELGMNLRLKEMRHVAIGDCGVPPAATSRERSRIAA
jgi:hypothetical protein